MKKNIKYILISMITLLIICIPKVNAATEISEIEPVMLNGQKAIKYFDNPAENQTNYNGGQSLMTTIKIDGQEKKGFCIEIGVNLNEGVIDETFTLYDFFHQVLNEKDTKELIRVLNLYIKYGYGSPGKDTVKYYMATQQLIWIAISDTGFYNTDFYAARTGDLKYQIKNFHWKLEDGTAVDISTELDDIKQSIKEYYKTPSLCTNQETLEIEIGETVNLVDNNNILQSYNTICENGITCTIEGNQLKVTAEDQTGTYKITFQKPAIKAENYAYRYNGGQGIIPLDTVTLDEVSCEFAINTYKNVQTSGTNIVFILFTGLLFGIIAYIMYYTKTSLEALK